MKNIFNILRTNKALAFASVALFLVSVFTISLTLNLSQTPTNIRNQAAVATPTPASPNPDGSHCNSKSTKTSCSSDTQCQWIPQPCAALSVVGVAGIDFPSPDEQESRYLACASDTGCMVVINPPACRKSYTPILPPQPECNNITNVNTCVNTQYLQGAYCNWYFTCVGRPGHTQYRESETGGVCNAKFPASATPPGGGGTPPGATATPTPPPGDPGEPCSCDVAPFTGGTADKSDDNFCFGYPGTRNTCAETIDGPEGYCDSNRDGIVDGPGETVEGHTGWTLGWTAYDVRCGHGGAGGPTDPPATPPPGSSPTPTLAPTPETIYPEANLTHNCSASQDLWPAYDFQLTSINNITQFWKATFSFCLHPIGTYSPDKSVYNKDHTYLFMNFFESKATWVSDTASDVERLVDGELVDLPIWACYNLGGYTEIPGEPGTNFINHFINGNTYLGSTKTRADGTIYYPQIRELAEFTNNAIAEEKMSQFTEFIPKVVLAGFNGTEWRVNDQTILSRDTDGKGHMQLHTGIGTCAPDVTNEPTPTPVPTCEYVTVNVPYSKYIADKPGHTVVTQPFELNEANLPQLDRTQPLKIGVDWGWTGSNDELELGPLSLPDGTEEEAGENWQSNEKSKVEIQGLNEQSISLQNYTPINCPDVGEVKRDAHTLFSDGRTFWFIQDLLNTDLRDVSLEDEDLKGKWYTCPLVANNEPQLSKFTETEQIRPDNEWMDIQFTEDLAKLRFTKSFTGDNSSNGSHFTRILVRYCKTNEDPTPTLTPTP